MTGLIRHLVNLVRVKRHLTHPEIVNLGELAHAITTRLQIKDPARRVVVSIDPGLSARGDKHLLKIMLTRLLENAWKLTSKREKTEIIFGKEKKKGLTVFFIHDNSPGFDVSHSHKLFGRFGRLAIVRRIVHKHGGRIWAEAELNRGATFYFTLEEANGA
jgi:signal transduction histidine kinase